MYDQSYNRYPIVVIEIIFPKTFETGCFFLGRKVLMKPMGIVGQKDWIPLHPCPFKVA